MGKIKKNKLVFMWKGIRLMCIKKITGIFFSNEIYSGLPFNREIKYQIDLVPEIVIPNSQPIKVISKR